MDNPPTLEQGLVAALLVVLVRMTIKTLTKKAAPTIPARYTMPAQIIVAAVLVWLFFGHPVPSIFGPRDDPRLDSNRWWHASGTDTPYKWWQFGVFGVDTIMPVPACTHYDRAKPLQDELVQPLIKATDAELLAMSTPVRKEHLLRHDNVLNSSLDGREHCFMTARQDHLTLTTTMAYLTTDTIAPSLIDFVRYSPHRDLLAAQSDGRVEDVFVSTLGETFVRVVAIVKQAPVSNRDAYTLALKRVLLPLVSYIQWVQAWYDDQLSTADVRMDIDPCNPPVLAGIFRSGLYPYYDKRTKRFSLLARVRVTDRNEHCPELVQLGKELFAGDNKNCPAMVQVNKMSFVDYLNPYPAYVYRRLPESLQAPFVYPASFQVSYYNLSSIIHSYPLMSQRMRQVFPGSYWLPLAPNMTDPVDHVPLAVAPLDKLVSETHQWIEQDDVTRCLIKAHQIEEAIYKAASE